MGKYRLVKLQGPVLVEPSQLYCKSDGKVCKYCLNHADNPVFWCKSAFQALPESTGWKAPDWCPHKWEALFGGNNENVS